MKRIITVCLLSLLAGCASNLKYHKGMQAAENEDFATAVQLWRPLAENGYKRAQFSLAELYHEGLGVPEDIHSAMRWYRHAAEQGHVDAQNSLGIIYDDGDQVRPDIETAMHWYRLAAVQGDPGAQFNLGSIYREVESVQDNTRAWMWWGIAAYQGNDLAASLLESVAEEMTAVELEQAETMARRCVKSRYRDC